MCLFSNLANYFNFAHIRKIKNESFFFTFWLEERVGNKIILFWIWQTSKAGWKDVSRVSVVSFDWFPGIAVEFGRIFN